MNSSKKYMGTIMKRQKKKIRLNFEKFIKKKLIPLLDQENKKISAHRNYFSKNDKAIDPVTKHDMRIEKKIRELINKFFPDHSIKGEEFTFQKGKSDYEWCIDPIDGTKALIAGQPTWSNMIGLSLKNNPIYGLIYFPELKKYYFNNKRFSYVCENRTTKKIKSKKNKNLDKSYLITNSIHTIKNPKILKFFQNYQYLFKITGTDAYNFCLVAEGKIDILIEAGLKEYDIIPHLSILEKSGAIIKDWQGGNNFLKGEVIVSSNSYIHKKFIKYFKTKVR